MPSNQQRFFQQQQAQSQATQQYFQQQQRNTQMQNYWQQQRQENTRRGIESAARVANAEQWARRNPQAAAKAQELVGPVVFICALLGMTAYSIWGLAQKDDINRIGGGVCLGIVLTGVAVVLIKVCAPSCCKKKQVYRPLLSNPPMAVSSSRRHVFDRVADNASSSENTVISVNTDAQQEGVSETASSVPGNMMK